IFITLTVISAVMSILIWINYAHPFRYDRVSEFIGNSFQRWLLFTIFVGVWLLLPISRFRQHTALLRYIALAVLSVDGYTHLRNQNPATSSQIFQADLWAQAQSLPKPEHGLGRVFITPEAEARLLQSRVPNFIQDLTGKRLALWSHLNLLDGVPKV